MHANDIKCETLTILSTNARSVSSKLEELKATVVDLGPDLIAITKMWTNSSIQNSQLGIEGYQIVLRRARTDTKDGRGGGILMYAKSSITCHELEVPLDVIQLAAVQIKLKDSNLKIHTVYRSPNSSVENNINLNEYLRKDVGHQRGWSIVLRANVLSRMSTGDTAHIIIQGSCLYFA